MFMQEKDMPTYMCLGDGMGGGHPPGIFLPTPTSKRDPSPQNVGELCI